MIEKEHIIDSSKVEKALAENWKGTTKGLRDAAKNDITVARSAFIGLFCRDCFRCGGYNRLTDTLTVFSGITGAASPHDSTQPADHCDTGSTVSTSAINAAAAKSVMPETVIKSRTC